MTKAKGVLHFYAPMKSFDSRLMQWPESIRKEFASRLDSGTGTFGFRPGSEEEERFLEQTGQFRIETVVLPVFQSSAKNIAARPFYHLLVNETAKGFVQEGLMDRSGICGETNGVYCTFGERQARKVIIDSSKFPRADIVQLYIGSRTKILVISRKLRQLIQDADLKGYRTVPCLKKDFSYSEMELAIDKTSAELERLATHFQLIVTEQTSSPYHLRAGKKDRVCSNCGRAVACWGFDTGFFVFEGLKKADFQSFDQIMLPEGELVHMSNEWTVVSSRFLELIVRNKLKGLTKFRSKPFDIAYWAVDIEA